MFYKSLWIISFIIVFANCSSRPKIEKSYKVQFHSATSPAIRGEARLIYDKTSLKLQVRIKGLKPNSNHGMHVHEFGICEGPGYESSGDHFNPHKTIHGGVHGIQRHLGDFGNLSADSSGTITQEIDVDGIDQKDIDSLIGKAIIIHAKADDLRTQPSGDSGDRLGCGIIK